MNEEEAIEKIKWSIQINNATKEINGDNTSINVQVLETVLILLENKDKESHFIQSELDIANAKIIKLNKMIDLMAEEISKNITNTCPLGDYNYDLDCENKCNDDYKECWKQYFENKAKEV